MLGLWLRIRARFSGPKHQSLSSIEKARRFVQPGHRQNGAIYFYRRHRLVIDNKHVLLPRRRARRCLRQTETQSTLSRSS